jgi:hypothetical protein
MCFLSISADTAKLTDTTMTNGTVVANDSGAVGRTLTVTLTDNQKVRIVVPPTAPITRCVASDRSSMSVGSSIFAKTNPGNKATLIWIGKGVTPPM